MLRFCRAVGPRRRIAMSLRSAFLVVAVAGAALAHPLGNFTINHFSRIELEGDSVRVRFVIDMAEISTLQELQQADTDGDGSPSSAELNAYLERVVPQYAERLRLTVDGTRIPLRAIARSIAAAPRDGGLLTLRIECDFAGEMTPGTGSVARRLRFEDANHPERIGWHEIVVVPSAGISVYDSNAYSDAFTNELKNYPADLMIAPLDERHAELSFIIGDAPAGVAAPPVRHLAASIKMREWSDGVTENKPSPNAALRGRDDGGVGGESRRVIKPLPGHRAALISASELTPLIVPFGLLVVIGLSVLGLGLSRFAPRLRPAFNLALSHNPHSQQSHEPDGGSEHTQLSPSAHAAYRKR